MIFVAVVNALFGLFALVMWAVLVVCYYTIVALIVGALVVGALLLALGKWAWNGLKSLFARRTSSPL